MAVCRTSGVFLSQLRDGFRMCPCQLLHQALPAVLALVYGDEAGHTPDYTGKVGIHIALPRLVDDVKHLDVALTAMHDIGNAINRNRHAEYGGLLANEILKQYGLSIPDRITIVSAISNHDESTGGAVDPISAALIIGDKTDVRRSRVREKPKATFDIHDRVNYAVTDQTLKINTEKKVISLNLQIDTDICSMYEYFEIFLQRMLMCRGAADMLGATFKLTANGAKVL